jgi:peptidoglycan/xylan/chitin deacetylase (PgdA/CDA1 family)
MYHRIAEESFDPWGLAVSPARFAEQIAWLKEKRQILPLHAFVDLHRAGNLPAKAIAITFDDGYACNASFAAPLLERMDAAATIFLPAEAIAEGREFWWDELERIVMGHAGDTIDLPTPEGVTSIQIGAARDDDRNWRPHQPPRTARQQGFHLIWSRLRTLDTPRLREAMQMLRRQSETPESPRKSHRPMTAAEVRRLQSDRIVMGSHSLTHTSLPHRSASEQTAEIVGSRRRCAEITGKAPLSFAYPYGDYDENAAHVAEQAGYICACTTEPSAVGASASPYALPRIQVEDWDAATLARTLRTL